MPVERMSNRVRCVCDCGNETIVGSQHLRNGKVRSCGCLHDEGRPKHGMVESITYSSWQSMRQRCLNPNAQAYANYGGRGVTICERWSDFANFVADMGERPSLQHSIDRFPNNAGNYEPGNCRWATKAEQNSNTRRTILVDGMSLKAACAARGVGYLSARKRVLAGQSAEEAIAALEARRTRLSAGGHLCILAGGRNG